MSDKQNDWTKKIEQVYPGFYDIRLHQHRRGGYRITALGHDKGFTCVIGAWGTTIDRAIDKFVDKIKRIEEGDKTWLQS
ncbi:MAG: hypothetical protein WDA59_08120 [Methanofastidiosum sp.]